jgi:DNA-directed RNA polymerase subunit L
MSSDDDTTGEEVLEQPDADDMVEVDYDSIPSTDAQIMSSIHELMLSSAHSTNKELPNASVDVLNANPEEDFPAYKARMKDLLEQLLLKLEEDVDYQKNLEAQIEDLEQDMKSRDMDVGKMIFHNNDSALPHLLDIHAERITRQAKQAIEECKQQASEMADEMMNKMHTEIEKSNGYKQVILHLQKENAKLKVQ